MKNKHHLWAYGFLTLALVGAVCVAAYQANRVAQANGKLEKVYQSAMLETVDNMGSLAVKLEKVLLTEDAGNNVLLLSQISNQAGTAQKNISILPLSHDAAAPLIRFCAQTGEYAQALSKKLADGETLDEEELSQVATLLNQCTLLLGQLFLSGDEMEQGNLLFNTDSSVFYSDLSVESRPLESLGDKDNGMNYPTLIYDGAFSDGRHRGEPKALPKDEITHEQAIQIARTFVGEEGITSATEAPDQGGAIPCFGVQIQKNDMVLTLQITKQGGKVLLMLPEKAEFEARMTLEEAKEAAKQFLEKNGFESMEPNYYQMYDGLAVINFASSQDGVLLYPDMVKAQVRLDTGETVGIEANNYWMNHTIRTLEGAAITKEQAEQKLSSRLNVTGSRLCVIPFKDTELLCYEFSGDFLDSQYLVYIDALTGNEVQLLKIVSVENGVLTL